MISKFTSPGITNIDLYMNTEINYDSKEIKKLREHLALMAKDKATLIKKNELKAQKEVLPNKVWFQISTYTSSYHKC
jgi:Ca2+-binding EF-hand superfamily protein